MKKFFKYIKDNLKYGLIIILGAPILCGLASADDDCLNDEDLMRCLFRPAVEQDTIIDMGEQVSTVGTNVFGGGTEVNIDFNPNTDTLKGKQSVIVKITKFLLSIVIAISVTMILWNGIKYIIETGNGKESKDLIKNLIFIIVGILLALFSVTIIRLMQSIGATLDAELGTTSTNEVFQK